MGVFDSIYSFGAQPAPYPGIGFGMGGLQTSTLDDFSRMGQVNTGAAQLQPQRFGSGIAGFGSPVDRVSVMGAPSQNQGALALTQPQVPGGAPPTNINWSKSVLPWINGGIQAGLGVTNAILGFQSLGLAKDQFNFQKNAFNKNWAASVDAYNTAREDRIRGRGYASKAAEDAAVERNKFRG